MSNRAVSVLEFVGAVQGAIIKDFGREGESENALVVSKVEIELKTGLEEVGGGAFECKVIAIEGHYANSQTQTLALAWERRRPEKGFISEVPDMGYDLLTGLDALRIGESIWRSQSEKLPFDSLGGTLTFEVAVSEDGKLTVMKIGGSDKEALTHTVKLTLSPLS